MERLHSLVRSLKSARSYDLAKDNSQAYYQLLSYVLQNQHKIFIELLESSPNFDLNYVCGRSHRTLLHMSANVGAYECLQYLLKRGAEPNLNDLQGITPLQVASRNGFVRCISKLLENGADIGIKNNEGMTAVHWLAANGRTEVFTEIEKYISSVDVKDNYEQTPLHVACLNGHKSTVLKLIELKADIEMENVWGCTPLYFACRHGHAEVVASLIQRHATLKRNSNGESPVDAALSGGYSHVCLTLIEWHQNLLQSVLQSSQNEGIEVDKIKSVLTSLMFRDMNHRDSILSFIAKAVHNEGMKLLSQSSDYEASTKLFLKNIDILNSLLSFNPRKDLPNNQVEEFRSRTDSRFGITNDSARTRHDSTRMRTDSAQIEKLYAIYESEPENVSDIRTEINGLWNVLESWMCVLQNEVSNCSGTETSNSNVKPLQNETVSILRMEATNLTRQASLGSSDPLLEFRQSSRNSLNLDRLRWSQPALQFNLTHNQAFEDSDSLENSSPTYFFSPSNEGPVIPHLSSENTSSDSLDVIESDSQYGGAFENIIDSYGQVEENDASISNYDNTSESSIANDVDLQNNLVISETSGNEYQVIDLTGDRLCCVIHGYFLYCQCQSTWKKLKGKISSFNKFIKKYETVLILLVTRKPQLIFEHFSFILESPLLLQQYLPAIHKQPLKERQEWFYERLHANKKSLRTDDDSIINVERTSLLETSCQVLGNTKEDTLKENITIRFYGEEGVGAGVTREWFGLLVKEILNPDCALFTLSADGSTFQPNCNSSINPDHLSYFQFAGRVMGLALYHKHLITAYFTRSFYKHILGIPVSYTDVESIDPEYAKNLQWLLDNDIDNLGLDITFSVETDVFGQTQEVELKKNGKSILVTDENKFEYVYLAADLRMTKAIKQQMFAFLKGFYEFIPHSLALLFNEYELELMLSGVPDIDIDDWKKNTTYQAGFTEDSPTILWFWEVVSDFSQEEQIQLLQFVTGTSRVPWGGFCNLAGINGSLFTICRTDGSSNMLPMASTCFNLIKLPEYVSKEELRKKVKVAVTCGNVGFEFT